MKREASKRISAIALSDPVWRYLILFQSWSQFLSCAAILAVVGGIGAFLIWLAGDAHLILECVGWGLLGGLGSVVAASRAQFSIRAPTTSEKAVFENTLDEWNYVKRYSTAHEKRFEQNLPRFLRWSDSNVTIVEHEGVVTCTGPQTVIRRMRKLVL